jgi:hypothetical protein
MHVHDFVATDVMLISYNHYHSLPNVSLVDSDLLIFIPHDKVSTQDYRFSIINVNLTPPINQLYPLSLLLVYIPN